MKPKLPRRDFLKYFSAGTSYIAISAPLFGLSACNSQKNPDSLQSVFSNPPATAKPFFRWWWNGNRITKKEVARELELMKGIGAGGVEINPIAINAAIKNPKGIPLEWLSEKWIDVLKTAISKGNELGMISDMIIGTGWPFGGKFLADEETIQGHDIFTQKIKGPSKYIFDKKSLKEGAEIKQAKLIPIPISQLADAKDLTSEIKKGEITVPRGEFEILVISWRNKFREVTFGAPGGDGPVLDHFNKTAVEKYLNRTSDGLKSALGEDLGKSIQSMFCDSIELSGANWTGDFINEFKKRNGYDVWEYLPLILTTEIQTEDDFNDTLLRVRYDYYSTLSELFMERFVLSFHNWCKKIGVKSRYQAYGHPWIPTDLLDGNMVPDIPEGDQWLFNGGWTATQIDQIRYAIWDKYTSSAAHLRGLKVASCEAMTNTSGVFSASLEYIKQATDLNFVAGINHFVLHGWNYSPPEAGFPGWIRFGTYFSEQNPWFQYLKLWSDYTARLSAVFQNSTAVCQVAIIGPTADRWSESGLDRNPFLLEPWYLHSLWQAANHNGYCSDYLNPKTFAKASYENGKIIYGPMSYQAVIICGMQNAFPEFIDALKEYAKTGGKIIFIGQTPSKSPGMKFKNNNSVEIKTVELFTSYPENVIKIEEPTKGEIKKLTHSTSELLTKQKITPGVKISNSDERLFIYQAKNANQPVFFFSNQNRNKTIAFDAEFSSPGLYPWKWDAETGKKSIYSLNQKNVGIYLKPLESLLLVFSEEKGEIIKPKKVTIGNTIGLNNNWLAEFTTPENKTFTKNIQKLGDLSKHPGTETFGGTIVYRNSFQSDKKSTLDLGKVAETAEVILNGKNLGVKYWGERIFDISEAIIEGENKIEIKVTTLLWNYCNSFTMEENAMAKHWANHNRIKNNKPLPTGLIGPVKLT